ncbi:MAG: PDZ domain-containing protein, partial [Alistipes sp.]|nr:PDZ domain-containing protein [Alistipes sp.]
MFVIIVAMAFMSGCSDDGGTTTGGGGGSSIHNFTEGVVAPSQSQLSRNAMAANITLTITTEGGYKVDVDNQSMASITAGASASKGGTHKVSLALTANDSDKPRSCNVFIQVDGYKRIKLYEITQEAKNLSDVVEWMDGRLQDEYYWLDEYIEKRGTFDFSLEYDEFLSSALLSMTTNMDDGGVYEDGERYIFSYIDRESTGETRSIMSEDTEVNNYGIGLASMVWTMNEAGTEAGFAVWNVYPESPAAKAGLKRGDIIVKIDGKVIGMSDWNKVNEQWLNVQYGSGSMKIGVKTYNEEGKMIDVEYVLTSAFYENTPVAYSGVLPIEEDHNPNGRKVGYLSYLSFEQPFVGDLVEAVKDLSEQGITDMILDLRSNPGGHAVMSVYLSAMMIDESYGGKLFATYIYNPKNKRMAQTEEKIILDKTYYDPATGAMKDLPHLNMQKVWILADDSSASCSESVIVGLQGLDIPVEIIGTTTRGKNCGMLVTEKTFGSYNYIFAPITFMHANAKGFSDYGEGIKADVDIPSFYYDSSLSENLRRECGYFPMPRADWGDYQSDLALAEAVNRICKGKSILDKSYGQSESVFRPRLTTRSGAPAMRIDGR